MSSDEEDDQDDDDKICDYQENLIGTVDSETLATTSWVQLPLSSIQETCFLGRSGRDIEGCIQANKSLGSREEISKHSADDSPRPSLASPTTGDFSFLDLPGLNKLRNCYTETLLEHNFADTVPVHRFARPEELIGGPVTLLLRPDSLAQGILMPTGDEIFFSLYGALIRVSKIAIEAPLGESVLRKSFNSILGG